MNKHAISEVCETDYYGKVYVTHRDPCSIRGILCLIEGQYIDLMPTRAATEEKC